MLIRMTKTFAHPEHPSLREGLIYNVDATLGKTLVADGVGYEMAKSEVETKIHSGKGKPDPGDEGTASNAGKVTPLQEEPEDVKLNKGKPNKVPVV